MQSRAVTEEVKNEVWVICEHHPNFKVPVVACQYHLLGGHMVRGERTIGGPSVDHVQRALHGVDPNLYFHPRHKDDPPFVVESWQRQWGNQPRHPRPPVPGADH